MQTRRLLLFALVSLMLVSLALLTACGSSSSTKTQSSAPVFTSVPVTAATQDVAYTYQPSAVDPAGGSVTFSLTNAPTNATLSGSTISWTPTAAQSRVSNNFAVTATTALGGTASQSWTVTPGGTITVNWTNNYWAATGEVPVPALPSVASNLYAIWTNPDGSYTVQKSSATSSGVFSIPNVPAGYYWLQIPGAEVYTNTSTFDAGSDIAGAQVPYLSAPQETGFNLNLSGLESVPENTLVEFVAPWQGLPGFELFDNPNTTSISVSSTGFDDIIDWSKIDILFFLQYVPTTLASLNNVVMGTSATASGLTLVDGATNTITEALQPSAPASVNLEVLGATQWAPLFTGVGPSASTPYASALLISAQPYVTSGLASGVSTLSSPLGASATYLTLAGTAEPGTFPLGTATCNPVGFSLSTITPPTPAQPAITTDQDFGAWQYGDPFPSGWARTLSLCQEYTVPVPLTGSSSTATFYLVDSATVAPSTSPLAPVVLPVQNPTITISGNAASLFTSATLDTNIVSLSWTAPAGRTPFAYTVRVYVESTFDGNPDYGQTGAAFSTSSTSINLLPLAGGNTYVFAITADADGTANIQTAPFRSSLPTGTATVVSAPITISSGALTPAIHGDGRVITRLSQPQSRVTRH